MVKLAKGLQSWIAEEAGVSLKHLNEILHGKRRPSSNLAQRLEAITGISRLKWLYPKEFGSPLEELSAQKKSLIKGTSSRGKLPSEEAQNELR